MKIGTDKKGIVVMTQEQYHDLFMALMKVGDGNSSAEEFRNNLWRARDILIKIG